MKKTTFCFYMIGMSLILTSCATNSGMQQPMASTETSTMMAANGTGGRFEQTMDTFDKDKLSHALDKALNKTTEWENTKTGITYTVTPIEKVVAASDDTFCRMYRVTTLKADIEKTYTGKACVSAQESNWRIIN